MSDLLVRDIEDDLKGLIEERAHAHRRSLSEEIKSILRERLVEPQANRKLGSEMFNLIRPEDRGDDLVFEIRGEISPPPDLE